MDLSSPSLQIKESTSKENCKNDKNSNKKSFVKVSKIRPNKRNISPIKTIKSFKKSMENATSSSKRKEHSSSKKNSPKKTSPRKLEQLNNTLDNNRTLHHFFSPKTQQKTSDVNNIRTSSPSNVKQNSNKLETSSCEEINKKTVVNLETLQISPEKKIKKKKCSNNENSSPRIVLKLSDSEKSPRKSPRLESNKINKDMLPSNDNQEMFYKKIEKKAEDCLKREKKPSKNKKAVQNSQKKINLYFEKLNNNVGTSTKLISESYLSPSAKLDSKIPKIEDILRDRQESEKFKQIQALVEASSTKFLKNLQENDQLLNKVYDKPKPQQILDCKLLTAQQIEKKFNKDVKFLDDIFYGKIYNERHEKFKFDTPLNNFTGDDLRVNESTSAFTDDQLICIISLFRGRYDHGNRYKFSDYYFKVLLPEYCLKIFMDCHEMNNVEAMEYLKSVPMPNHFGLD